MFNFFLLCALSVFVFGVSHKGSFLTLTWRRCCMSPSPPDWAC
jgi:hypothetical protein